MTVLEALIGLGLGAIGGAAHLAVTRWRASLATKRGIGIAMMSFPLSLIGPAAAILLAAWIAPISAWIAPIGLFTVRWFILSRYRDSNAPKGHQP